MNQLQGKDTPTHRKKLNQGQYDVLRLLHTFRFGTTDLLAAALNKKNGAFIYSRLKILTDQGYVGRHYKSSYRLRGQYASYYLTPLGGRALQKHPETKYDINIKALYKNKTLTESFIRHCLDIFTLRNLLTKQYGDSLKYFVKSDLAAYDYFPRPLPDAYARLKDIEGGQYFIKLCHSSQPYFTLVREIKAFIDYADSGEWDATETELPAMLLVCDSYSLQMKLQKQIVTLIGDYSDEVVFALTTKATLLGGIPDVWQVADDPDAVVALHSIS